MCEKNREKKGINKEHTKKRNFEQDNSQQCNIKGAHTADGG